MADPKAPPPATPAAPPPSKLPAVQQSAIDPFNADLFDMQTKQRVVAKDMADLQDGIKTGRYGYGPSKQVNVYDSDGNLGHVDASHLQWALSKGGYSMETPEQATVREYVDKHKGLDGAAKVALGQFVDEALFGVPEEVYDRTADPLELAKKEALKKEHNVANALGGLGGFGASLLYGGEFFNGASKAGKTVEAGITGVKAADAAIEGAKALQVGTDLARAGMDTAQAVKVAPSLAREVIGKAAGMGVEGAIIGAPKTLTEEAFGDHEAAAESLALNFGLGAGLGAIGALAKGAVKAIPSMDKLANEQAFRNLNYSRNLKATEAANSLPEGVEGVGKALRENGLIRNIERGETWEQYAERINQARSETGQKIGGLYDKLDTVAAGKTGLSSGDELADRFRSEVIDPLKTKLGTKGVVSKLNTVADEFETLAGKEPLGFKQLHDFRSQLDDMIWKEGAIGITDPAKKELKGIRDIITNELESKGDALAKANDWRFKDELDQSNLLYRRLKVASSATEKSASTVMSNRIVSPSDYGVGIGTALHFAASPLSAVAGVASSIGHKWLRENGNAAAAKILSYMGQKGEQRGLMMTEEALKNTASKMDQVPGVLKNLASGFTRNPAQTALAGAERLASHSAMADKLTELMADPQSLHDAISLLSDDVAAGGAPTIANLYKQKQLNKLTYLYNELPKPQAPVSPFSSEKFEPTHAQATAFARKLEVADDPFVVMQLLQSGQLTPDHVNALKAMHPATYRLMVQKIKDFETSGKAKPMSYSARQQLAMLTGESYGTKPQGAGKSTGLYQTLYAPQNQPKVSHANNKLQSLPDLQQTQAGFMSTAGGKDRRRIR